MRFFKYYRAFTAWQPNIRCTRPQQQRRENEGRKRGEGTGKVSGRKRAGELRRWCAKRTWRFLQGESPCWVRANHPPIPSVATDRKVVQEE